GPGAQARGGHRGLPATWGLLITGFGLAPDIWAALGFLVLAGGADMVSGIFRDTLWNQTIPDRLRARMAGLELLSYGLGPSAGQIRAGAVASVTGAQFSIASGGVFCAGGSAWSACCCPASPATGPRPAPVLARWPDRLPALRASRPARSVARSAGSPRAGRPSCRSSRAAAATKVMCS